MKHAKRKRSRKHRNLTAPLTPPFLYNALTINLPPNVFDNGLHFVEFANTLVFEGILPPVQYCTRPCCRDPKCNALRLDIKSDPHTYDTQQCRFSHDPTRWIKQETPGHPKDRIAYLSTENSSAFDARLLKIIKNCPHVRDQAVSSVDDMIDFYKVMVRTIIHLYPCPSHKHVVFAGDAVFSPFPEALSTNLLKPNPRT